MIESVSFEKMIERIQSLENQASGKTLASIRKQLRVGQTVYRNNTKQSLALEKNHPHLIEVNYLDLRISIDSINKYCTYWYDYLVGDIQTYLLLEILREKILFYATAPDIEIKIFVLNPTKDKYEYEKPPLMRFIHPHFTEPDMWDNYSKQLDSVETAYQKAIIEMKDEFSLYVK